MPKVRVPASAGEEITLTNADGSKSYKVTDGEANVAAADLALFLGNVEGAREVAKPAASSAKEK